MKVLLGILAVIVGAARVWTMWWRPYRHENNWDERTYPARPTGQPSPRRGDDPHE